MNFISHKQEQFQRLMLEQKEKLENANLAI
jgi:hypothetical protein